MFQHDLLSKEPSQSPIDGVTVREKIKELQRELRQRESVYGRLVAENKLTPQIADKRKLVIRAILNDYYKMAGLSTY